jgi:hypothetical protein
MKEGDKNIDKMINLGISQNSGASTFKLEDQGIMLTLRHLTITINRMRELSIIQY